MAEATLSTTRSEILMAVGDFLGYGRNPHVWTREQTAQITRILRSGERQFYAAHPWSFMRLSLSLSITADDGDTDLPDGFGGFFDQFLSFAVANSKYEQVRLTSVPEILRRRQNENLYPADQVYLAAVNAKTPTGTTGQRFELLMFPAPDANGTLKGNYYAAPDATTDSLPYAMGGEVHSETLLACCLAAAELERDKTLGPMKQQYMERLANSMAHDQRTGPKTFGYNGDGSAYCGIERHTGSETLTYNGDPL